MNKYINYELVKSFSYKEEYEDLDKPIKNVLTDFINDEFLKYNHNIVNLIKLIYDTINPILKKYKLKLLFKGGNVLRLYNNNIIDFFPPKSEKIIEKIFEPFLKQSDIDFTIYLNPNIKNYEKTLNKINFELLESLNKIRNKIINNPEKYFNIYNLNQNSIKKAFNKLNDKLGSRNIDLGNMSDKLIFLENEKDFKSDILVFEDTNPDISPYFNSLNTSLNFFRGDIFTKFNLLRTKINFKINNKIDLAGELIDISIPHKKDSNMKKLNTTKKYNKFIKDNIKTIKRYDFKYNLMKIPFLIKDLHNVLYIQNKYPWMDKKYKKRLARLLYFIFLYDIDNKKVSMYLLNKLKKKYNNFKKIIKNDFNKNNIHDKHLMLIINSSKNMKKNIIKKDKKKYSQYKKTLIKYINEINKIINSIINYMRGQDKINQYDKYNLNIV